MKQLHRAVIVAAAIVLVAAQASFAELTRVTVTTRTDITGSPYEKIVGKAFFAVDPRDARNKVIADIDKAPVNSAGRVEFSSDLYILHAKDGARSVVSIAPRSSHMVPITRSRFVC